LERGAKFFIGQVIVHRLFSYRGVIVDVDPVFSGTEEWYQTMARTRPPRDKPWYRVLVDGADHETYVAERNLMADSSGEPISHPLLNDCFDRFENGIYIRSHSVN
jgi:heat shock protein HspQ